MAHFLTPQSSAPAQHLPLHRVQLCLLLLPHPQHRRPLLLLPHLRRAALLLSPPLRLLLQHHLLLLLQVSLPSCTSSFVLFLLTLIAVTASTTAAPRVGRAAKRAKTEATEDNASESGDVKDTRSASPVAGGVTASLAGAVSGGATVDDDEPESALEDADSNLCRVPLTLSARSSLTQSINVCSA